MRIKVEFFLITALLAVPLQAVELPPVWVVLVDKPDGTGGRVKWLSDRSDAHTVAEQDLPLDANYVRRIKVAGVDVRVSSRWFNAVSVVADERQRRWLTSRRFVRKLCPVRRWRRPVPTSVATRATRKAAIDTDLGPSPAGNHFEQIYRIGLVSLHNMGYWGQGVRIGLLDSGFHHLDHPAFSMLEVVGERDFVNGDDVVGDEDGQLNTGDESRSDQNAHGTEVLSVLAGFQPGYLIGAAPQAEFLLAKTEDNGSETPVEEDFWIAGLEWLVEMDVQVVNSSVGYNTWDGGGGYRVENLDGQTAWTTRAAAQAVRRGVVVVAAAGNEGNTSWKYVVVPADADSVIAVGAVGRMPQGEGGMPRISPFSSRGPTADGRIKPDVVATGESVLVVDGPRGYVYKQGTSFAAPLVTGACALLLQVHPDWGPADVLGALKRTAVDLGPVGPDTSYGWGLVDVLAASGRSVQLPVASVSGPPFPNPARDGTVYFPLQLAAADDVGLRVFDLSGELVGLVAARPYPAGVGQQMQWMIPVAMANGLYYYKLTGAHFARRGKIAVLRKTKR